jgi:GcrA cell cycle regulator
MSWNHERIEELKRLWEAGYTASNIASELGGITRNAVIGKAHRLGLSGRNSKIIELTTSVSEPMNPMTFAQIKDGLCRWPLGEPEDLDFKFCGRSSNKDKVYCSEHHELAYQPLHQIRKKKAAKIKFNIG